MRYSALAGGLAAAQTAIVGTVVASAVWNWRHLKAAIVPSERFYGDGSLRYPLGDTALVAFITAWPVVILGGLPSPAN